MADFLLKVALGILCVGFIVTFIFMVDAIIDLIEEILNIKGDKNFENHSVKD